MTEQSDGTTADYYDVPLTCETINELAVYKEMTPNISMIFKLIYHTAYLPVEAKSLQDLISSKNLNAQYGEIFRACYRYGEVKHSPKLRDAKKILYYANAELDRLEAVNSVALRLDDDMIVANKIIECALDEVRKQTVTGTI